MFLKEVSMENPSISMYLIFSMSYGSKLVKLTNGQVEVGDCSG